jgi:hypothetical protein
MTLAKWIENKFNSTKSEVTRDADKTAKILDKIAATITQTSSKLQNRLTTLFASKLGAAGISGSAFGLLSLGTASTGTAIGTLSGAAATTAKLFWAGSLVGGGVAVGVGLIAGASIIGGFFFGKKIKSYVMGDARKEEDLSEDEKRILSTCRKLSVALKVELLVEDEMNEREFSSLQTTFVSPLIDDLQKTYLQDSNLKNLLSSDLEKLKSASIAYIYVQRAELLKINKRYTTPCD